MSSAITSASEQMTDFMTLFVTELQNQNPLEPLDNQQMAAQLAQFSQLEQTEQMNGNIEEMNTTMKELNTSFYGAMVVAEYDFARSLLGKEVSFYSGYYDKYFAGNVEQINIIDGIPKLEIHAAVTNPDGSSEIRSFNVALSEVEGIKG